MNADDLAKLLDELGQRLGPTGQHVFELAVRQVYINGIVALIALAVMVIGGAVAARPIYRWVQDGDSYSDRSFAVFIGGVFYVLALMGVVLWAILAVPAMLNPEYAAIRDLLGTVSR